MLDSCKPCTEGQLCNLALNKQRWAMSSTRFDLPHPLVGRFHGTPCLQRFCPYGSGKQKFLPILCLFYVNKKKAKTVMVYSYRYKGLEINVSYGGTQPGEDHQASSQHFHRWHSKSCSGLSFQICLLFEYSVGNKGAVRNSGSTDNYNQYLSDSSYQRSSNVVIPVYLDGRLDLTRLLHQENTQDRDQDCEGQKEERIMAHEKPKE